MEQPKFKWCREAIEQVRFKPDRDKIWDELIAHIVDHVDDLVDSGLTEAEAEAQAVEAMGDPVTIGKQLDAIHKPWLGWLWKASRWLVLLLALTALALAQINWYDLFYDSNLGRVDQEEFYHDTLSFAGVEESQLQDVWAMGSLEQLDFTVDKVRWVPDGRFMLRFRVKQPWYDFVSEPAWICQRLYLEDETGNRWVDQNLNPDGKFDYDMEYGVWAHARDSRHSWTYVLTMYGVPQDAPWLDLCYDYAGRRMTIRIDLTGGETP